MPAPLRGQAHASGAWARWLGGGCSLGCVVLLLTAVAGVALGGAPVLIRAVFANFNCLPGEFPKYPGSTVMNYTYDLNAGRAGSVCRMTFVTGDSESRVHAFFESKLNTGNWQVTSDVPAGDSTGGQIIFEGRKTGRPHGFVIVSPGAGDKSQIVVELDS